MSLKSELVQRLVDVPFGVRLLILWGNLKAASVRRRAIGRMSTVSRKIKVVGWDRLRIGSYTTICDDTWFVANHQQSSICIENHVCIATRNFFTCGSRIIVGDFTLTAPDCLFLGAHHDYSNPKIAQIAAPVTKNGIIDIGVNCSIGGGAIVLANSRIGHGSIVGAGAVVRGTFPAFSLLVGNPARIIKRFNPIDSVWVKTSEFQPELEFKLPDQESYRRTLERQFPTLRTFPGFASRSYGNT